MPKAFPARASSRSRRKSTRSVCALKILPFAYVSMGRMAPVAARRRKADHRGECRDRRRYPALRRAVLEAGRLQAAGYTAQTQMPSRLFAALQSAPP